MALLPHQLTEGATEAAQSRLETLLNRAGLQFEQREDGVDVSVGSVATEPHVRIESLHDDLGALRADVESMLTSGHDVVTDESSRQIQTEAAERMRETRQELTFQTDVQWFVFNVHMAEDTVSVIREYIERRPEVRLYRIHVSEVFRMREMFWRIIDASLGSNIGLDGMMIMNRIPTRTSPMNLSDNLAGLFSTPLAARQQPLGFGMTARRGAKILAVLQGSAIRPAILPRWPSSAQQTLFSLERSSVYSTSLDQIPEDWAIEIPRALAIGINALAELMTDPDRWVTDDGHVDVIARNCMLRSLEAGIAALADVAEGWGSSSGIWAAFRSLTVLAGIWGDRDSEGVTVGVRHLLDPRLIQRVVVPRLAPDSYQQWAREVVANHHTELLKIDPDLDKSLSKLQHVRNLVHGVTPSKRFKSMEARLDALNSVKKGRPVIPDIAAFWWTVTLMWPYEMLGSDSAPFNVKAHEH